MKLINKTVVQNPQTFEPELELTIRMPIQFASGDYLHSNQEIYEILGPQFVDLLLKDD